MKSVNLIPAPRRQAKRLRAAMRRSAATCAAYGVLLTAAGVAAQAGWHRPDPALPGQLDEVAAEITQAERAAAVARNDLTAATSLLHSTRLVCDQPDWGLLLGLLAQKTGDDVLLKGCDLRPAPPKSAAGGAPGSAAAAAASATPALSPAGPDAYVLNVTGIARSQLSISEFVLRLERTGLFDRVSLIDTAREQFRGGAVSSFNVECSLTAAAAAKSLPAAGAAPREGGRL